VITTITDVNSTAPYHAEVGHGTSYAVDPVFLADGYHLDATSTLKAKAPESLLWWEVASMGPLLDIDGETRPIPAVIGGDPDIGCDERQ
jgi:hypothetical protein